MKEAYKRQVALLLNVLPELAKEKCFALHGGTAINLFVRNMPRLSVDMDLTYLVIEDRETSMVNIVKALNSVTERIQNIIPNVRTNLQERDLKLQISLEGAQIKIEVNQINRGCISKPEKLMLCDRAQETFDAFCAMDVVPKAQLFGGKIIAALDRQHPRDLFDIKYLLEEGGIDNEIKEGFIFSLLSSNRPIYELLNPHSTDQHQAFKNQFYGMSDQDFTYQEFEEVREAMVKAIHNILNEEDKKFIISFKSLMPDWSIYDFHKYPAIQWKLENLQRFKDHNEKGYKEAVNRLVKFLENQ
jgi:predicted nucleotidyltransferase component of viral defense system